MTGQNAKKTGAGKDRLGKTALAVLAACAALLFFPVPPALADDDDGIDVDIELDVGVDIICPTCPTCALNIGGCSTECGCTDTRQTGNPDADGTTMGHIKDEFILHREWLVLAFWQDHILPALMLMTEQLSAAAMQQVLGIGMLLDAQHQLETQRLFQELQAQAHKDYQPSEGMCQFGTNTRSLAASDRNAEFSAITLSARSQQRQLLTGDVLSASGGESDRSSRMDQFIRFYCNPSDNSNGMDLICRSAGSNGERWNKDIDYTRTVDIPSTLEIDFKSADGPGNQASADETDIFALAANLYAHDVPPQIPESYLADTEGNMIRNGAYPYMDLRALTAKRSVAHNSFAAIAASKAQGGPEAQPYLTAILREMGTPDEEIEDMLGTRPSYYAQMEILTKRLYQNPVFYADLYDKPANVRRKNVSMQAIETMQKRDIYRSLLRSEATMAVWLETLVEDYQERITSEVQRLQQDGPLTDIEE